jgi:two-component system sensor histidine kinase MprB
MSLRFRLALALALLAAASIVAVATTNYFQTSDQLHKELDGQLRADVRPLLLESDPKQFIATQLCFSLATNPDNQIGGYASRIAAQLGNSLQCIDGTGKVVGRTGKVNLPVDLAAVNRQEAAQRLSTTKYRGERYRTVVVSGGGDLRIRVIRSLARTEKVLESIRDRSIYIGIGVILIAAAGGWLIARRTARPLGRLTKAAEEVAATGRLDHPVPTKGRGEVGRLARAFTSMLRALDDSHARQQRLVQDASHELRTPLTSLRTNLDTLRRHEGLDPELREQVLTDLDSELQELGALTNELVQLAVDAHSTEPEIPIDLDALVEQSVERARRRSGRVIDLEASPARVVARPDALSRAVGNLIDNAIKFSPDESPIEVRVHAGSVEVRDHGPGINAHDAPFIFDRFYRADSARPLPGSGLGLSIAREVVDASGGHLTAENDPAGGARLTIVLPTAGAVT